VRIANGDTSRKIYFAAKDATDKTTPETSLTNVVVYYSIDGGASTAVTTPTVAVPTDGATNMPGIFCLSIDEAGMVAVPASRDECEVCLHITSTEAAPVDRVIEIFRPKATEGNTVASDASGHLLLQATQTGVTIPTVTTITNEVSANIKKVNDVTVTGTGALGNEWGP
jgi:hypothetical protein